jgi:hypothetical protein
VFLRLVLDHGVVVLVARITLMPFQSRKQQRFMYARHPKIAKRWQAKYGNPRKQRRKKRKR